MKTKAWIRLGSNSILEGDGFYVSYNPNTSSEHNILTDMANMLGADVDDGEETALVKEEDPTNIFYILTGDFRKEYEQIVDKGFADCLKFFKEMQSKFGNNWSTNEEDRR